jgi:predicted Fe-Mo cluster-binding NifX family protein
MNGKNLTELADPTNARSAKVPTFTEHRKIEATHEHTEDDVGMDTIRIAIPCIGDGTLEAQISPHFGRCDSYAIVTMKNQKVNSIDSLSNANHSDCSSPVQLLAERGVGLMLVTGMGMRPYLSFRQQGIEVRYGATGTVADAIEAYVKNETLPMTEDNLCGCHNAGPHDHFH